MFVSQKGTKLNTAKLKHTTAPVSQISEINMQPTFQVLQYYSNRMLYLYDIYLDLMKYIVK